MPLVASAQAIVVAQGYRGYCYNNDRCAMIGAAFNFEIEDFVYIISVTPGTRIAGGYLLIVLP